MEAKSVQRAARPATASLDGDTSHFERLGRDFARESGSEATGPAGAGTARLMPQRALVDYAVGWFEPEPRPVRSRR